MRVTLAILEIYFKSYILGGQLQFLNLWISGSIPMIWSVLSFKLIYHYKNLIFLFMLGVLGFKLNLDEIEFFKDNL